LAGNFNIEAIKRKLDHLHTSMRIEARRTELLKPWPGMVQDVRVVVEEMALELRQNRSAHPFLQDVAFEGDTIRYRLPAWIGAARRRFSDFYDPPEDEVRWEKALTVFQERLFRQLEGTSDAAAEDLTEILAEMLEQEEIAGGTA
jgi:hypothetical protein